MEIEPTYRKLIGTIKRYIENHKQLALAGMHDAGKTYLFYKLKQSYKGKKDIYLLDFSDDKDPDLKKVLSSNDYKSILTKGGVVVINFGYMITPTKKLLSYLISLKRKLGNKFSWILFINYFSYRQKGDIIYQKMLRVNFLAIPPLSDKDFPLLSSQYEEEIGKISESLLKSVKTFSGGNPGLYKSLWGLAKDKNRITVDAALKDSSTLERLERMTAELDSIDVAVLLGKSRNDKLFSRLRLLGYLNSEGKVFTPLLREYLKRSFSEEYLSLKLTPNEKDLLNLFLSERSAIISRDEVAQTLWKSQWNDKYSDWAIDKAISELRKKLKGSRYDGKITTKRGEGYYFR